MVRQNPTVLITCTQPRADTIVNDLIKHGIAAMACPALCVTMIHTPKPQGIYDAMLITSRHALNADLPKDIPVVAIGEETALHCREAGLSVIQTGEDNLKSMDLSKYSSILYPCALHPSLIPTNAMNWSVYETIENDDFHIPETIKTICVFSVKGARIIKERCHSSHRIICLSQPIAYVFHDQKIDNLAVCAQPRYDIMKEFILNKRDVQS